MAHMALAYPRETLEPLLTVLQRIVARVKSVEENLLEESIINSNVALIPGLTDNMRHTDISI